MEKKKHARAWKTPSSMPNMENNDLHQKKLKQRQYLKAT